MGEEKTVSSAPLFKRIGEKKKGGAAAFAKRLNISEQTLSNWKRRKAVPRAELHRLAPAIGMTVEQYLQEAGYPSVSKAREDVAQYTLETPLLVQDFEALPDGLREYVARKTSELRAYAEALPKFIRDALRPPSDQERLREWERDIEADMLRIQMGQKPQHPPPPAKTMDRVYRDSEPGSRKVLDKLKRHRR